MGLLLCKAGLFFLPLALLIFCRSKVCKGVGICALVIWLGAENIYLRQAGQDSLHYLNAECLPYLRMEVCREPEERERTFRTTARLLAVGNDSLWQERHGLLRVYFKKDSRCSLPHEGDCLVLSAEIRPIEGFMGKDGRYFDYAAFMAKKRIYGQVFLNPQDFRVEAGSISLWKRIKRRTGDLRARLACFWDKSGLRQEEVAVAKALILGERDNNPVEEAYRKSGVIHVLAVSGMHLSIFSCMVAGAFGFLRRKAWQRYLRFFIVLLFVWGYALLTGLSASVCRAACMFSFVGFGKCMGRNVRITRSLAVSALFLLLIDPGLLYDIGFLLSYAAVLGLSLFTPIVGGIWKARRRIPVFFRDLVVASVSAQIATLPIILCVFGSFPTYFLIGNCIVAPLVNIALPFGIIVTAFSLAWESAALFLSGIFGFLLRFMNEAVGLIMKLPAATLQFSISLLAAVWLYCTIAGFWRSIGVRSAFGLRRAMVLLLLFCWMV